MSLTTRTNQMLVQREKIRELESQLKTAKDHFKTLELDVLAEMREEGIDMVRSAKGSMSRVVSYVPQIEDYDAFWKYIRRTNQPELLQRRPSVTAWRELRERRRDGQVPGLIPFEKESLSLREKKD